MNRLLIWLTVIGVLMVAALIGAGVYFGNNTRSPSDASPSINTPSSPAGTTDTGQERSATAVKEAYRAVLPTDNFDNIQLFETMVSGNFAIQSWEGDNFGGEALLRYDAALKVWTVVDPGGGRWSIEGLKEMGVPATTAEELVKGLGRNK